MASTYSTLKIQLMATGENLSTWGTVTNTNLGTAIEEAIVGSADVTFSSGTVTLSLSNTNATQSARNLRLNLTGTSGGAQNLIVPAIEKVYIVNNGCADPITVKNATGTGIAVPAGKTTYLYNNGTNVVDAITHLTSLTLASPLGAASGGMGLTSYNSGGAVYATSTSALTTGTLPVASGGTGAVSLTANNVILGNGTSAVQVVAPGTSGNVLASNGTTWASRAPFSVAPDVIINASTMTALGFRETIYTCLLDTIVRNVNSLASLSSYVVTLPAGTYMMWGSSGFAFRANNFTCDGYVRIRNTTDSSNVTTGITVSGASDGGNSGIAAVVAFGGPGVVTIDGSKNFELQLVLSGDWEIPRSQGQGIYAQLFISRLA